MLKLIYRNSHMTSQMYSTGYSTAITLHFGHSHFTMLKTKT